MDYWKDEYRRLYGEAPPSREGFDAVVFNRKLKAEVEKAAPDGEVTPTLMAQCARRAEGKPA